MGCRRGCGVIIPVASLFHPSSFLLPTGTSCRLSTSHPHLRSCNNILAATQRRCDSRHASQRPLRHTQDPPTPVCQVPPTSLKQGIWLHNECYGGQEVRSRSGPGITREISQNRNRENTRKKKTRSSHYHTHTKPINHSSHLTLADTLPSPPHPLSSITVSAFFLFIFSIDALCALAWPICKIERSSAQRYG